MNGRTTFAGIEKYTNSESPPFKCKECTRIFDKPMALKMHFIRSHTGRNWDTSPNFRKGGSFPIGRIGNRKPRKNGQYQCPYCDHPPFKSEGGIRYHTVAHHGRTASGKTGAKCPECGYQSSPQGVALHRSLKHGVEGVFGKAKKNQRDRISKGRAVQMSVMQEEAAPERQPRTVSRIFGGRLAEQLRERTAPLAREERRVVRACPHCFLNLEELRASGLLGDRELAFCPVDGVDIAEIEEVINR